MPRISAATVAEHRRSQRAALLRAAREVMRELGVDAVTPRVVGQRAGLARSSVYEYFKSRDDLVAAVAVDAMEQWSRELDQQLQGLRGHVGLRALVDASLRMAAADHLQVVVMVASAHLSPSDAQVISDLHQAMTRPIRVALADEGVSDAAIPVALIQGILNTGVDVVSRGADRAEVRQYVMAMVDAVVGSVHAMKDLDSSSHSRLL